MTSLFSYLRFRSYLSSGFIVHSVRVKGGWEHQVCPFLGIFRPFFLSKNGPRKWPKIAIQLVTEQKNDLIFSYLQYRSYLSFDFLVCFLRAKGGWKHQVCPFLGIFRPFLKQKRTSEMGFSSLAPKVRAYRANRSKRSESGERSPEGAPSSIASPGGPAAAPRQRRSRCSRRRARG